MKTLAPIIDSRLRTKQTYPKPKPRDTPRVPFYERGRVSLSEQIRFGEKLHAAFGSRGPASVPNEYRNMWVDRAFYVMQGLPGGSVPRGDGSWYGDHAPLFGGVS